MPKRCPNSKLTDVTSFHILLMMAALVFFGVPVCGVCNAANNPSEVLVGSELDFPPYALVDESGTPTGFSIDLIKAVTDATGVLIKISTGSWDTVWNALVAGRLDVLPIVAKAPERQRFVDFSLPHTETYDAFFVRQGDPPIKNIAAAQGMDIVAMRSDAAHHELQRRNFGTNLVLVETIPKGLALISSGKHNALLCSKLIGTLLIKKHGLKGLTAGPIIPDYKRVFSFAVKKGDTELLEKLNQGLLIVKTNGEYDRIYDKWLSADDPWRKVKKYILPAVIVTAALALIAGIWLVMLQRIIKKRNSEIVRRKNTEEALRESESRYRELFNSISSGVAIYEVRENGADFVFKDFNRAGERIDGDKREDLIGKSIFEVRPGIKEFGLLDVFKKVWETGIPEHFPVTLYKHAKISQWYKNFVYKLPSGEIVAVFDNITEIKRAEKALLESEERFRRLFEQAPLGYQSLSKEGCIIDVNPAWLDLMGYSRDQVIGQWFGDFLAPMEKDAFKKRFQHFIATGEIHVDLQMVNHAGSAITVHIDGRIAHDDSGQFKQTHCILHDITERRRTEEDRAKLQVQLSNAIEIARLGHWEYDVINDIFTFNDHFYNIFRTTANQVGGYTMKSAEYARRFVHPDDMLVVGEETRKAIETTDPHFSRQLEHRILYADKTVGHITIRFFIVKDAHGRTIKTYGVNQDITERKRLEEELLKAQKLESVGILAGGIAHDFNNILTMIIGNVSLAKMQVKPKDEIFDLLHEAETASTRAQTLTKQLLTFAKGGSPLKETASIKEIIEESSLFVLRGSKSRCEFSIAQDLRPVDVDTGQISQVINNIVINADQAMPGGGTIQVAAENLIIEDRHGLPVKPGGYIKIFITDQGVGIAEKHLSNIFDPYFTTKQEGSGLGLATSYSIIKRHEGHITVESQLGVGTTFHIYLPASDKIVPEKEEVKLIKGHGRILVMDDETSLRKMVGKMLEKLGYESEFAKDGAEAIRMVKEAKESEKPYDAVILDLTVPGGMGGKETIKKLMEINPEIKAIVSSGYSDDPVLSNFQEYGFE
ncbi:PAS domain S-box protein, partial [Thermodesulfobacteriota bacterium]